MEITDNGKGFNKANVLPGTGLQNIKKRAVMLNGIIKVNSVQDTGTQIKIEIPLKENDANS
jgi:signal transduction histidine kinase